MFGTAPYGSLAFADDVLVTTPVGLTAATEAATIAATATAAIEARLLWMADAAQLAATAEGWHATTPAAQRILAAPAGPRSLAGSPSNRILAVPAARRTLGG